MSLESIRDYIESLVNKKARFNVSVVREDLVIAFYWYVNGETLTVTSCSNLGFVDEKYIDMMIAEIRHETGHVLMGLYRNE